MARIVLEKVSKQYSSKGKLIVNQIDLDVRENEFLVLVGPSGCGKTTTLRMIAGLESITAGDIYMGEIRVNDLAPRDRNVSMVFQNYALYPHLNVFGNLAFGLKLQKQKKEEIEKKVAKIASMLELEELLKRKPGELSGGQRQRVALGRALIRDTEVMLMDEPLSNLDAKLRVQTRGEILNLHKQIKRTVVYVTHDQVEAMTMGDRIAVMYDGRIQQIDIPETVYDRPANMFVAGFVGTPAINFLSCAIESRGNRLFAVNHEAVISISDEIKQKPGFSSIGQTVVLGIRPEDLALTSVEDDEAELHAVVDVVESLGFEQLVTVLVNGEEMTIKSENKMKLKRGESVGLRINHEKIHIFDKETEVNLLYAQSCAEGSKEF